MFIVSQASDVTLARKQIAKWQWTPRVPRGGHCSRETDMTTRYPSWKIPTTGAFSRLRIGRLIATCLVINYLSPHNARHSCVAALHRLLPGTSSANRQLEITLNENAHVSAVIQAHVCFSGTRWRLERFRPNLRDNAIIVIVVSRGTPCRTLNVSH